MSLDTFPMSYGLDRSPAFLRNQVWMLSRLFPDLVVTGSTEACEVYDEMRYRVRLRSDGDTVDLELFAGRWSDGMRLRDGKERGIWNGARRPGGCTVSGFFRACLVAGRRMTETAERPKRGALVGGWLLSEAGGGSAGGSARSIPGGVCASGGSEMCAYVG